MSPAAVHTCSRLHCAMPHVAVQLAKGTQHWLALNQLLQAASPIKGATLSWTAGTFPHLPCYAPLPIDTRSVVYKGAKCGPRGSLIKWTAFYIPNASDGKLKCGTRPLAKGRDMYNRVTFGSCGVPPAPAGVLPHRVCGSCDSDGSCTDAGPVAPPGRAGWLTRYPVVPGELVLPGMTRIRADRGWLTAGYSLSDVVVVVSASV